MGATEVVASFVVHTGYQDLPSDVVDKAKRTALDTVAAALAGCVTPDSRAVVGYVKRLGGAPQAVVLGGGFRVGSPRSPLRQA